MTANEMINEALKQIVEPIVREHVVEVREQDMRRNDVSMQRERSMELEFFHG